MIARSLLSRAAFALVASLSTATVLAQVPAPREGVNYTVVKPAQPTTAAPGKVEVIEFFGYWCPHCNEFEPTMTDWSKRNEAKVTMVYVPIPLGFRASESSLQKLYYTLDVLGREKELRGKVFAAIHADHSLSATPDVGTMADWAAKYGIDKKKFVDTLNSFTVQTRLARGNQMAVAYGVTGVPTLGIGGKYSVTVDSRTISYADQFLARALAEK
ncbi:MAG: thiol:disulfide interchange protein DsbA/DsbL [Burkholderiaceae bacterium]